MDMDLTDQSKDVTQVLSESFLIVHGPVEENNAQMDDNAENMNSRKINSMTDIPKPLVSQMPRTPLVDVKNQFRLKARQRMSTGSMKNPGFSLNNRLSLNDEGSDENVQRNVKFFKSPNENGEGKVALMRFDGTGHSQDETQSTSDMPFTAHSAIENSLDDKQEEFCVGANEISRDGESLKYAMSVLDQDLCLSNAVTEEQPFKQIENISISLPLNDSRSEAQSVELKDNCEGDEFVFNSSECYTEQVGAAEQEPDVAEQNVSNKLSSVNVVLTENESPECVLSALDHDTLKSDGITLINSLEQEERPDTTSLEISKLDEVTSVQSTQEILSDIQTIELNDNSGRIELGINSAEGIKEQISFSDNIQTDTSLTIGGAEQESYVNEQDAVLNKLPSACKILKCHESLDNVPSFLDEGLQMTCDPKEIISLEKSTFSPTLETVYSDESKPVHSSQEISNTQEIQLNDFEGKKFGFDSRDCRTEQLSANDGMNIVRLLQINASEEESVIKEGVRLLPSDDMCSMMAAYPEEYISFTDDDSFDHVSSSFRESLSETQMLLASTDGLDIIDDIHELSSIRLVEGCENSNLDALLEATLTEEIPNDFEYPTGLSEIEEITATLEKLSNHDVVNNGYISSGMTKVQKSFTDRITDGSLLADLSISEVDVLSCFGCTPDMSKFIDEFLRETPETEHAHDMPIRFRQQTLGKRDDMWPSNEDQENENSLREKSFVLETKQNVIMGNERQSLGQEHQDTHSLEGDLTVREVVDDASVSYKVRDGDTSEIPEGELSDKVDVCMTLREVGSFVDCNEEVSVDRDENSERSQELLLTKSTEEQGKVSESDDLYSLRVSKVLESLREAYVTYNRSANVEKSSESKLPTEIPKSLAEEELRDAWSKEEEVKNCIYEPNDELAVLVATDAEECESPNVKQHQSLNRSTIEMQEEIKSLELQMMEMKEKVCWLESQIELNSCQDNQRKKLQDSSRSLDEFKKVSSTPEDEILEADESDNHLNDKKKLIEDLENRLAQELHKTRHMEEHVKDMEGHVKNLEKKCALLEKERLSSELKFAKELRRLNAEYAQSISHLQAEEEQGVGEMEQEFDCMMSEFERMTLLKNKLKDMLNRVMRTTNDSLAGYAKLLRDYSQLQENHRNLEDHLSATKSENKKLVDDVEVLENLLQRSNVSIKDLHQLYQEEINSLKSQTSSLSEAVEVAAKEKEVSKKCLEEHVDKLQQSVARLETERQISQEEMEDTRFLLEHQKTKNQTLSEEIDELKKIKIDWIAGQDLIRELQDTLSFLNEERAASVTEYELAKKRATSLEADVNSLTKANQEYQSSQDQLQTQVSSLRERLYMTSEDATMLLAALEDVEAKAESLLDTLQRKFGIELSCDSAKATPKQCNTKNMPSSLVAQILSRAGVEESQRLNTCSKLSSTKPVYKQSNVTYGSIRKVESASSGATHGQSFSSKRVPSSRKALDFSSLMNPTAVEDQPSREPSSHLHEYNDAAISQDWGERLNTSIPGFAHIRSIPLSGKKNEKEDSHSSSSENLSVLGICENVVESIEQKFSLILKLAHTAERTSRIKIRDLNAEIELMTEKYKMKRGFAEKLDIELESKRQQLLESRGENEQLNERVNNMTQAILQHEDMTYEVKRLEEENHDLQKEIHQLKGERDVLSKQVQDLISKASGSEGEQASLKKIAALEKKFHHLHYFTLQEQEKSAQKGEKAMRRIRVLEMNLKRAEEEVVKFDELVEAIRNTCIENRSMRPHPVLLHVVRLIDGLVEVEKKSATSKTKDSSKSTTSSSRVSSVLPSTTTSGVKEEYAV